jgi:hypothetical protein
VDIANEHDVSDGEAIERLHAESDSILRGHFDGVDATDATE